MATALAKWLQQNLQDRQLTLHVAGVHAGVSTATLSEIISHDRIPRMEILFRSRSWGDWLHRFRLTHLLRRHPPRHFHQLDPQTGHWRRL